jgi:hypothetical protein
MACKITGVSRAPGTVANVISSAATPNAKSLASHAESKPSPTSLLKRDKTIPIFNPCPFKSLAILFNTHTPN